MGEETPPLPPPNPSPCRCPRCDRPIRRAFSPKSPAQPTALARSTSSPLPTPSPPSARPAALFRNKSDVPFPSVPLPPTAVRNLALALRDPPASSPLGSPSPAAPHSAGESAGTRNHEEEMRKLKELVASLAQKLTLVAETAERKETCEVVYMMRDGNMLEVSVTCGCGRSQKVVAKVD